jgi:DNA replication protein DnaC
MPLSYNLDLYDFSVSNGLEKQQLNQLRELLWLEQTFNIILMGPSGTGKTFIAAGMCFDAVDKGYRAYFKTMEDLVKVLKMKDITRTAAAQYKRIIKAHLLVIDDIMMFPITPQDAVAFFNLINELHDKTSLIITTNKSPKEWAEVLKDDVLTTALLDRILHRCEIIKLTGKSYRMEHRKTIFDNNEK